MTAEAQDGVIARWQLRDAGVSDARITRWVKDERLCRRLHGVYALGHSVLSTRARLTAALLYAGPGAAISHTTAAWWWGVTDVEPRRIHVSATRQSVSTPEVKVHRPRVLERAVHRGLSVTSVARTMLDVAPDFNRAGLRRMLAEVEFRRLATLDELAAGLRRGHPGSGALRHAIAAHRPELAKTRSRLEERFVELCERYAIPMPLLNQELCGFVVDAAWLEAGLVVELDGRAGHAPAARMESDRRRDLALRAAGFDVWRYTWRQLSDSAPLIAEELSGRVG
jgi:hypothetical protein